MQEGEARYEIGGGNQKSSGEASGAESEWAKHGEQAEKTARENQAQNDIRRVIEQFQGNVSLIPTEDLTIYAESAEIYLEAVNDPDNNLQADKNLVMVAEAVLQESKAALAA